MSSDERISQLAERGLAERVLALEDVLRQVHHTCKHSADHEIDHAFIVEIPWAIEQAMPELAEAMDAAEFFGFDPGED